MSEQEHPCRETLVAFSLGLLENSASIENHVSECRYCWDTLEHCAGDDQFLELVRRASQIPVQTTVPKALLSHDRYEIGNAIGSGGMGTVYKANDRTMGRGVALKIINPDLMRSSEIVGRFHREIKATAKLHHQNLVTAYDAGEADDVQFLVLEFVDGYDLAWFVKDRGVLPIDVACNYACQAAAGLQFAHEKELVHRDIKPSNIMVTHKGVAKILDFGIASFAAKEFVTTTLGKGSEHGELTLEGSTIGTPDYISPEQAIAPNQADIRSDIYSLGATLYFLLHGHPPLAGTTANKENSSPIVPVPSRDIPDQLAGILHRMMAVAPDDRYQTPQEVVDAISLFLVSLNASKDTTTDTSLQPTKSTGSRRQWPSLGIVSLGLLIVMAAIVLYVQFGKTTLRFTIKDPSISVSFRGETIDVERANKKLFRVSPSTPLKFIVLQNGTEVETDSLKLRRGQHVDLKVDVINGQIEIASDDAKVQPKRIRSDTQPKMHFAHWTIVPTRPMGTLMGVAIRPNRQEFAYATSENQLHLRSLDQFDLLRIHDEHDGDITCMSWSPEGEFLLTGHSSGKVFMWFDDGSVKKIGEANGLAKLIAWNNANTQFAVLLDRVDESAIVEMYDKSGNPIRRFETKLQHGRLRAASGMAFSPDDKVLAIGHRGVVSIWKVENGAAELQKIVASFENTWVPSLVWADEGIVVSDVLDSHIAIIDPLSGAKRVVEAKGCSKYIATAPNGFLSFGASGVCHWSANLEGKIKLVDSGEPILTGPNSFAVHRDTVLTRDRKGFVLTSLKGEEKSTYTFGNPVVLSKVEYDDDGKHFAIASELGAIVFASDATFKWQSEHTKINSIAWCPQSDKFSFTNADRELRMVDFLVPENNVAVQMPNAVGQIIWNATGSNAAVLPRKTHEVLIVNRQCEVVAEIPIESIPNSASWDSDGTCLVVGMSNTIKNGQQILPGVVCLQETTGNELQFSKRFQIEGMRLFRDNARVGPFQPRTKVFPIGSQYGYLVLVDATSQDHVMLSPSHPIHHRDEIDDLDWHPKKEVLASSSRDRVIIWDLGSKTQREIDTSGAVSNAKWNLTGELLALAGSSSDVTITDVNGAEVSKLPGHVGGIRKLVWHPTIANRLLVSTRSGLLWQWDAKTGLPISMNLFSQAGRVLRFSPKGQITGASQEELDFLQEECRVQVRLHNGKTRYLRYDEFRNSSALQNYPHTSRSP